MNGALVERLKQGLRARPLACNLKAHGAIHLYHWRRGFLSRQGAGIGGSRALLQARGYTVRLRKLDPYLNVDPGTMSPFQHGEVFVTDDGAETDLDLGPL